MRYRWSVSVVLCILLAGCVHKEEDGASLAAVETKILDEQPRAPNPGLYMAYERAIDLDVEVGRIADIFHSAEAACRHATADQCVILESNLTSGRYAAANLKVRAKPAGIQKLMASVGSQGRIVSQTVTAEDLAGPIADATRRMEMLTDYRSKLESLRGPASSNIDALIKVNKELAEVQSQIEALTGEKSLLAQRVETETLTITIQSREARAFWRPVGEAVSTLRYEPCGWAGECNYSSSLPVAMDRRADPPRLGNPEVAGSTETCLTGH